MQTRFSHTAHFRLWQSCVSDAVGAKIIVAASYRNTLGAKVLVRAGKSGDLAAIFEMAKAMAPLVSTGNVLVPMPSHHGTATNTLLLANALAKLSGATVANLLQGQARPSQYSMKKTGKGLAGKEFLIDPVQLCSEHIVIDDVVGTGATARAVINATGARRFLAYAGDEEAGFKEAVICRNRSGI